MVHRQHQAFIIARVVPHGEPAEKPLYRCIGAIGHYRCYGCLPVFAARRFMTLVQHPDNAEIIRAEIQGIQGKYATGRGKPSMPEVPCPYATFLLVSAWNLDLSKHHASGVNCDHFILSATMASWGDDNHDGRTIIDITDPTNPRYGFLFDRASVLTAEQYIRKNYPIEGPIDAFVDELEVVDSNDDFQESVSKCIALLNGERLISLAMLAEAWPDECKRAYEASLAKPQTDSEYPVTDENSQSVVRSIPALADLAIKPAVEYASKTGDIEVIQELLWLPGKAALVKAALQSQEPFPDPSLPLLAKVLDHELKSSRTLDLSGFFMSSAQIATLLADLSSIITSIDTVKLSHSPPSVTIEAVRSILTAIPKLQRLDLLDTHISQDDIMDLITTSPNLFTHLSDLVHNSFLTDRAPPAHPNGFSAFANGAPFANIVYLPIWTPAKVIQGITYFLSLFLDWEHDSQTSGTIQSMVFQAMFSSGGTNSLRKDGQKLTWDERFVPGIPAESLATLQGGAGWFFAFEFRRPTSRTSYGFVKTDREAMTIELERIDAEKRQKAEEEAKEGANESDRVRPWISQFTEPYPPGLWKVYDLKGFLEEMEKEGRPLPEEKAIKDLEEILASGGGITLLPYDRIAKFMVEVEGFYMALKNFREVEFLD